jgi:hypothetical protein
LARDADLMVTNTRVRAALHACVVVRANARRTRRAHARNTRDCNHM